MNTNEHDRITQEQAAADAAARPALSALRQDAAPVRDLWSTIEARISVPAQLPLLTDDRRMAVLDELRTDLSPLRDLWPVIDNRIRTQRWRRLRTPLVAAASLAATLVIVLGLQVQRGSDAPKAAHAPLHASAAVIAAMQESPAEDFSLRPVSIQPLAPEIRALMRANLKIVANAETQLKRALASDPDAAYLESLLKTTRQQRKDLRDALHANDLASGK